MSGLATAALIGEETLSVSGGRALAPLEDVLVTQEDVRMILEVGLTMLALALLRAVAWPLLGVVLTRVASWIRDPGVSSELRATGLALIGVPRRQLNMGPSGGVVFRIGSLGRTVTPHARNGHRQGRTCTEVIHATSRPDCVTRATGRA